MGGHMENLAPIAAFFNMIKHKRNIDHLFYPWCSRLQIVEEHCRQSFFKIGFICRYSHHLSQRFFISFIAVAFEIMLCGFQGGNIDASVIMSEDSAEKVFHYLIKTVGHKRRIDGHGSIQKHHDKVLRKIFFLVISLQNIKIIVSAGRSAACSHILYKTVKSIGNPFLMLLHGLVIRIENLIQILTPQSQVADQPIRQGDIRRHLFFIFLTETGNHSSHNLCRMNSDITFFVRQKFIKKLQCQQLLLLCHIGVIFFKNRHVSPQVLPLTLASCRFDQTAEFTFHMKPAHQTDVVIHRSKFQLIHHILTAKQNFLSSDRQKRSFRFL